MKKPTALLSVLAFVFAFSAMGASAGTCGTSCTPKPCPSKCPKSGSITIKNLNQADIFNGVKSKSNTGFNKVFKSMSTKSTKTAGLEMNGVAFIDSGPAAATATSGTVANDSGINVAAPNMGGMGLDSTTTAPTNISVTNENKACVENQVFSKANTGGNYINSSDGDATITSGSATADSFSSTEVNTSTISVSQ